MREATAAFSQSVQTKIFAAKSGISDKNNDSIVSTKYMYKNVFFEMQRPAALPPALHFKK